MFASLVHRLTHSCGQDHSPAADRRHLPISPSHLLAQLPALGDVLYVPMRPQGSAARELPHGVLVEVMQLAPLLQTCVLSASSAITADGPREWIDCLDREGRSCARLHLLPDTDYLAWDRLLAGAQVAPVHMSLRLREPHPAFAQVVRFHTRLLAGLSVSGVVASDRISSLGRQLAMAIASADAAPLRQSLPH